MTLPVEITYDLEYTAQLRDAVTAQFASAAPRDATHLSDLLYCLLKAWGKQHLDVSLWSSKDGDEGDPLLTWLQGLQFEALVSTGQKQRAAALCFKCNVVSSVGVVRGPGDEQHERAVCPVCGERWLVATPDYIVDGVIHESKQTRKSQRRGPQDAPWWIEQLAGYILFARKQGSTESWGRRVVNWLMGDYGEKKRGRRPRPPRSELDAFRARFSEVQAFWDEWQEELRERKRIVEGPERPPLSLPGDTSVRVPAYEWECASCPVGKALECPNWRWNDDDEEIVPDALPSTNDSANAGGTRTRGGRGGG